jgi:hypothetical protein
MTTVADQFAETRRSRTAGRLALGRRGLHHADGRFKAIMSGRTDEIIDLAKTNLWC